MKTVSVSKIVARTNLVRPPEPPARYIVPGSEGEKACYLGHTDLLRKPVFWRPEQHINYHIAVVGSSGAGKTYLIRTLGLRAALTFNANVLVLDISGEYAPLAETAGGHVIQLGIKHFLNIMDLCGMQPAIRAAQVVEAMQPFFDTDRATRQARILRDAIDIAYMRKGILNDDPDTWDREPPTLGDAYRILRDLWRSVSMRGGFEDFETAREKELAATLDASSSAKESLLGLLDKLRSVTEPPHDYLARQSTLTLSELISSGYVVLDLSRLPSESARISVCISVLQFIVEDMRRRGMAEKQGLRLLVTVDEAWKVMAHSATPIKTLVKEGRKYGVGVIAATQDLSDLSNDDYVINNAGTIFALMIEKDKHRESIANTLGLGQRLRARFEHLVTGQAIVKYRFRRAHVPAFVMSIRAILPPKTIKVRVPSSSPLDRVEKVALQMYSTAKRYV